MRAVCVIKGSREEQEERSTTFKKKRTKLRHDYWRFVAPNYICGLGNEYNFQRERERSFFKEEMAIAIFLGP